MLTQKYPEYSAVKRAVQTFSGLKKCNILGMNWLGFCLFQAFSMERPRNLDTLPLISSYLIDVEEAFLYSKHPQYR